MLGCPHLSLNSQIPVAPQSQCPKKKIWQTEAKLWVRGATGHHTLPHPPFPFFPTHSPLLFRQAGVGQRQPCLAQFPQAWEPRQVAAQPEASA